MKLHKDGGGKKALDVRTGSEYSAQHAPGRDDRAPHGVLVEVETATAERQDFQYAAANRRLKLGLGAARLSVSLPSAGGRRGGV